jgi:hypothetical protein
MSLYSNGQPQPTSAAITGQYLAKAHLTYRQYVKLAAALSTGAVVLSPMTIGQAAALVGVPVADVSRARRNGKPGNGNGKPTGAAESLAAHIARSSPAERVEAAQAIGLGVIWDTMISPACDEDRAQAAE